MTYLICVKIDGKNYLTVSDNRLQAFHSIEKALESFDGFSIKLKSDSYSDYTSAAYQLANLNPEILQAPEDANELSKHIVSLKPVNITGGSMTYGQLSRLTFIEVLDSILELSVCNVFKTLTNKTNKLVLEEC